MKTKLVSFFNILLLFNLISVPTMAMHQVRRITHANKARYLHHGRQQFLARPYLEIPGTEMACQKKSIVNAWIYDQLKDGQASEEISELAALVSLVQPHERISSVTEKCLKKNMMSLCGEVLSNREADALLKHIKPAVNQAFLDAWQQIVAANNDGHKKPSTNKDVDVIFNFLRKQNLPIMAAIYIGSPTLDEVMQHRFQYVYRLHFDDDKGRFYAPPGFDSRDRAKGVAPLEGEPALIFHLGIPNQFYNQLSTRRFLASHPGKKLCGDTALAKLNLPNIDPKELMAYSLSLMDQKDNADTEPGYEKGSFRYPISLYHFSFAPSWPAYGQESYLGQPLWPQNFFERKMAMHRESYAGDYSPLAIYVMVENPLLEPFNEPSGFEFRLKKKGFETVLRLYARQKAHGDMDDAQAPWDFDHHRTTLTVWRIHGQERSVVALDEITARHYFSLITQALKVHLDKNFCFKTRYLIKSAGISDSSFSAGFLALDHAYQYSINSLH